MLELKFVAMTWLLPQRAIGTGLERDIFEEVLDRRYFDGILMILKNTTCE